MRDVLISLVLLSAVCTVALLLSPDGGLKKYVSLCCSLCAVAFIAASVSFVLPGGFELPRSEIEDKTEELRKLAVQTAIENIKNSVISAAEDKYGILPECISVEVQADASDYSEVKLTGIYITLSGLENAVKVTRLKTYIQQTFDCYTEVVFNSE